jgi:hypothetical protein
VTRRKHRHQVVCQPYHLRPPRQSVPVDLVGLCFNCLSSDHIIYVSPNVARYLRCHGEGHQTRSCKRAWLSDSTVPRHGSKRRSCRSSSTRCRGTSHLLPQPYESRLPGSRLPRLAGSHQARHQAPIHHRTRSRSRPGKVPRHGIFCLSSLPPHPNPLGAPSRQPHFEIRVIPCSTTIDEAEAGLVNALVALVGDTQPQTNLYQAR